jgi:exonuclease III
MVLPRDRDQPNKDKSWQNIGYLENIDLHLVIIDIKLHQKMRIINVYCPFNPPGNISAREFFHLQMHHIEQAYDQNAVLSGDFNLDWSKK